MTDETLTQSELDEIIGKLKRALERGEIEEREGRLICIPKTMTIGRQSEYHIRRKPIAGWVNVYPNGTTGQVQPTEESAGIYAGKSRIACVYVEETEAPGDG